MEQAIASNAADIENALNRAKTRAAAAEVTNAENAEVTNAEPAENAEVTSAEPAENAEFTNAEPAEEMRADAGAAAEKLPDDIPEEGFYELLFDLDELMKLGVI